MGSTVGNFEQVNGINLYYEIHGSGFPLVMLHGGGSTIKTSFGKILPVLAKNNRVIAIELQSHGHTKDIDRPLSFEQDADDVAVLLDKMDIPSSNFMGFSNGATTCMQIAIRHARMVNKMVLIAVVCKRSGFIPGFWDSMHNASIDNMPQPLKDAYLEINPDQQDLLAMFNRDRDRMLNFNDIDEDAIKKIAAPAMVINGDRDVITVEHAMEIAKTLKNARLVILPGEHGQYIGEICSLPTRSKIPLLTAELIDEFLLGFA